MAGLMTGSEMAKQLWPGLKALMEERYRPGAAPLFPPTFKWFVTYRTLPAFGIFRIRS